MKDLAYARVDSVEEALAAIREHPDAWFVAGGATAVDLLRECVAGPDLVIDISGLPLREIRVGRDVTSVGALVPNWDLAWHPAVQAMFPVVSQAILARASVRARIMASVGGNLLQKTDLAVALLAVDARVVLVGLSGEREIPIEGFYPAPGAAPNRETALRNDELILGLKLPHGRSARTSRYVKARNGPSDEGASASVAIAAELQEGVFREARLVLGGIVAVPKRAHRAEEVLDGREPHEKLFAEAADAAVEVACSLRRDAGFRPQLVRRAVIAALEGLTRAS